jgi:hypothetical protein
MNVAAFAEPRELVIRPSRESSASTDMTARTCASVTGTSTVVLLLAAAAAVAGDVPADAQAVSPTMMTIPATSDFTDGCCVLLTADVLARML